MKRLTSLFILFMLLAMTSWAWGAAHEEISKIGDQRIQAFNEGNLEATMRWFADDAVLTGPGSPFRIEGKAAIQASYVGTYQATASRLYIPRQRAIRVYGNTAVTNTYYTLTTVDRAGKATTAHGRLDVTYVKLGDRWLVVNQHSSLLPAP